MAPSKYDKKPKRGDLIEISRGLYQHWAVYVGGGYIVHLAKASDVSGASANSLRSVTTKKAIVKKEKLRDVVGNDECKINNSLDEEYNPRSVQDIVREALAKVGMEVQYSIFSRNCEHFANWLRYGRAESWQAEAGGTLLVGGAALVGLGVLAGALLGGGKKEKKNTE